MRILTSVTALLLGALPASAQAQDNPAEDPRYQALADTLPAMLEANLTASVSLTFIENGEIAWTQVYGEQSEGVAATPDTLYGLASLTKPIMAEVVLRLMSEGSLSLEEPVYEYWTDPNVRGDDRREALTPRLLLQHQGGFPNWRSADDGVLQFRFDPGTDVQYSGEGYDYLVRFLERKYGQRFEVIVQDILFDPVGMESSSLVYQPWFESRRAHRVNSNGEYRHFWSPTRPSAASSLSATTEDYARFVLSVMRNDAVSDRARAERANMSINQVDEYCGPGEDQTDVQPCPAFMGFGIGWFLYGFEDHTLFYHSGSNWGEKSYVLFSPDLDMGLVVATTSENFEVIYQVIEVLYGNADFLAFERG